MKYGTMVFLILAFCSLVSSIISFSGVGVGEFLGFIFLISAVWAFLQTIAWVLIAYMWETVME